MTFGIRRSPVLDPRHVIQAAAYRADPRALIELSARVEVSAEGWHLLLRETAATQQALAGLLAVLGLTRDDLADAPETALTRIEARSLGREIIALLAHRDWIDENDARPLSGQKLVVAGRVPDADLAALFASLNRHATVCRAARFQGEGEDFTLFHLRDDPQRGSSLRQFLASLRPPAQAILNAYETDHGMVFLPKAPPRETLAAAARLLHLAPELFGLVRLDRGRPASASLLFSFTRAQDLAETAHDVLHDLREVRFFGADVYFSPNRPAVLVGQPAANPVAAAEAMARRLTDPASAFARPLRLIPGVALPAMGPPDREALRLRAEMDRARRRLDQLELRATAPVLYASVDDAGFPSLARALRSAVLYRDTWHGVSYACLASSEGDGSEGDGRVRHLFRFDPAWFENLRSTAARGDDGGISWFWSDPTWLRHYGSSARIALAVPLGTALAPFPHSWSVDQFDASLAAMVLAWSGGRLAIRADDRPTLFVTPPSGGATNGRIGISLVSGRDLAPITGTTIAWMNDVLVVQRHPGHPVSSGARAPQVESLAVAGGAVDPALSAEAEVALLTSEIAAAGEGVLAAIAAEIGVLRARIDDQRDDARTVMAEIADVSGRYARMVEEAQALRRLHDRLVAEVTPAARRVPLLARTLAEDLQQSQERFQREIGRAQGALDTMLSALRSFQARVFFWRK